MFQPHKDELNVAGVNESQRVFVHRCAMLTIYYDPRRRVGIWITINMGPDLRRPYVEQFLGHAGTTAYRAL